MPLNLTTIALAWLAGSIILLPLMIVTIRFAVVPLIETITRPRTELATASAAERLDRLEVRVADLTARLEHFAGARTARGG